MCYHVWFLQKERDFSPLQNVQRVSLPPSFSFIMVIRRFSLGIRRMRREANHLFPSGVEVMCDCKCTYLLIPLVFTASSAAALPLLCCYWVLTPLLGINIYLTVKNLLYSTMPHVSVLTVILRHECTLFKTKWNALKYIINLRNVINFSYIYTDVYILCILFCIYKLRLVEIKVLEL
jgi:hypothetical protein